MKDQKKPVQLAKRVQHPPYLQLRQGHISSRKYSRLLACGIGDVVSLVFSGCSGWPGLSFGRFYHKNGWICPCVCGLPHFKINQSLVLSWWVWPVLISKVFVPWTAMPSPFKVSSTFSFQSCPYRSLSHRPDIDRGQMIMSKLMTFILSVSKEHIQPLRQPRCSNLFSLAYLLFTQTVPAYHIILSHPPTETHTHTNGLPSQFSQLWPFGERDL